MTVRMLFIKVIRKLKNVRGGGILSIIVDDWGKNNEIIHGKNIKGGRLKIKICGNNNKVIIEDECILKLENTIHIYNNNNKVRIGRHVTFDENTFLVVCEGTEVTIGSECIFANGVRIRTSDQHGIYNSEGNRINPAKDVHIGNHVWLGAHVVVMKGTSIGDGSVIGMNSMVTKDIPSNSLAVGTPAKVIKENINWSEQIK